MPPLLPANGVLDSPKYSRFWQPLRYHHTSKNPLPLRETHGGDRAPCLLTSRRVSFVTVQPHFPAIYRWIPKRKSCALTCSRAHLISPITRQMTKTLHPPSQSRSVYALSAS